MLSSRSQSPPFFFWQASLSVLLGVLAGITIFLLTPKKSSASPQLLTATLPPVPHSTLYGQKFPSLPVIPSLTKPMTILVMGVDSNGPKTERFVGTRSDTMIMVHLNPYARKVSLISIPRDSRVEISGHGMNKINSAHALGGAELAVNTVSEDFQTPIDHYIVVDTEGLKKLCELLGPMEILVEKTMHYHDKTAHLDIDLEPGLQTLDPSQTEGYVRFRHDLRGDIGRIERQQWFLRQVAHKLKEPQVIFKLPELLALAHDYVQTDMSVEDMAEVIGFAKDIAPKQVETSMLPGEAQMINGGSYWIPDLDACRLVFDRVMESDQAPEALADEAANQAESARPIRIAIKYPHGEEEAAKALEQELDSAGYRVRYVWLSPIADCQHAQIIENSAKANREATNDLRKTIAQVSEWPLVIAPDFHSSIDLTLVLPPGSSLARTLPPVPQGVIRPAPVLAN